MFSGTNTFYSTQLKMAAKGLSISSQIACGAAGFLLYHVMFEHGWRVKQTKDTASRVIQNKFREYGICEGSDCIDVDIPCSQAMLITRDFKKIFEINLLDANTNQRYVIHDDENILNSKFNFDADDIIMNEQYYVTHNKNNDIRVLMQFLFRSNGGNRFTTYKGKWDLIEIENGDKCRVCNVGKHWISSRNIGQLPTFRRSRQQSQQLYFHDDPFRESHNDKRYNM